MSHWNYRLCKSTYHGDGYEEVTIDIREVYYNDDGSIWAVTENAVGIVGETVDEVKSALEKMNLALGKDIIDLDTIVYSKPDFDKETDN